ncbi:hypothetical protein T439DRAFT_322518 [Meredithblackwellia eburnea MCA 4105]
MSSARGKQSSISSPLGRRRRCPTRPLSLAIFVTVLVLVYWRQPLHSRRPYQFPQQSPIAPFKVPPTILPVNHLQDKILYNNTPVSQHRPQNQFARKSIRIDRREPIITIFTCTQNPRTTIWKTWDSIRQSSIQSFRWLIVNDHTSTPEGLEILRALSLTDDRIVIHDHLGTKGLAAAKNTAVDYVRTHFTPYFTFLDDDDIVELTIYEKSIWMLESNSNWGLASFYHVKHGAVQLVETRGVHLGAANFFSENYVVNAAVVSTEKSGIVRFDESFISGMEDYDFWMSNAEAGNWGGTIPEIGFWYWQNDEKFRKERWADSLFGESIAKTKDRLKAKHAALGTKFPHAPAIKTLPFEQITLDAPYPNPVCLPNSVMIIQHSLRSDLAHSHMLSIAKSLATNNDARITVVLTNMDDLEKDVALRPRLMQYTHDVHFLPTFLRAVDQPRFVKYLIESRCISSIMISASEFAYELLPAIQEWYPTLPLIDFVPEPVAGGDEEEGDWTPWSAASMRYLWRTITPTEDVKSLVAGRGQDEERVGVFDVSSLAKELQSNWVASTEIHDTTAGTSPGTNDISHKYAEALLSEIQLASPPHHSRSSLHPALQWAIRNSVHDSRSSSRDFHHVEGRLVIPPRPGRGLELQNHCGETNKEQSVWIGGAASGTTCARSSDVVDKDALIDSALHQCGAYCIFDLRTKEMRGWQFNGMCWEVMDPEVTWCKPHWLYRPTIMLPSDVSRANAPPL